MIICEVNKNHLNVRTRELLTAGSQNVNSVEFRFNAAWDGLAKTATFKTSKKTISVLLNTNTTAIPWEALADAGEILAVGVFGVSGETLVLPTVWGILGKVMDAAHLGDEEKEPTPDVYQKILDELNALERPTWDSVQNKPFSTLGSGLVVDKNGVLSAEGGGGGSADNVRVIDATDDIWENGEHPLNMTTEEYQNILEWYRNQQSGVAKNILLSIDNRLVFQLVYIDGLGMTFIYSNSGYNRYVKVGQRSNGVIATTSDIAGLTKSLMEVSYLCNTGHKDDIIALFNRTTVGVIRGEGDSVPDNGKSIRYPALVFFGDEISYGNTYATLIDRNGVMWSIYMRLGSGVIELVEKTDYVTNTALTDILQDYVTGDEWEEILPNIEQAIGTKLDKNQGTANAGKILGIGADGIVVPQDKPTYTLPQATANVLGGIKADAATAEDTQVVRIGTDGKLRTKPTGGSSIAVDSELSPISVNPVQNKVVTTALAGKITAPTTASVGQIIKVKSVDGTGKPTEWEAVTAKLANPNALTFTGAVTGSYDGSEPMTVEIPSGGGSSGGSGKAKLQILINQEITELTASLSVTLEHDFHNLTAIIGYGSGGAALTVNSDGTAIEGTIALLIDTTSFSFNVRKVSQIVTSSAMWQCKMIGAEWSDDLSVFKRGFGVNIATGATNNYYIFNFGGKTAMYGTLAPGDVDNAPRTGKTANIVVNGAYLNVGTKVVLWGEYYE